MAVTLPRGTTKIFSTPPAVQNSPTLRKASTYEKKKYFQNPPSGSNLCNRGSGACSVMSVKSFSPLTGGRTSATPRAYLATCRRTSLSVPSKRVEPLQPEFFHHSKAFKSLSVPSKRVEPLQRHQDPDHAANQLAFSTLQAGRTSATWSTPNTFGFF